MKAVGPIRFNYLGHLTFKHWGVAGVTESAV